MIENPGGVFIRQFADWRLLFCYFLQLMAAFVRVSPQR